MTYYIKKDGTLKNIMYSIYTESKVTCIKKITNSNSFFTGHKNELIFGRAWVSAKNATKEQLRVVGTVLLVIATIVLVIGGVLLYLSQNLT